MAGTERSQQRKLEQMLKRAGVVKDKHLYSRCFVCDTRFIVNNYADGKARVSPHKFMGKIVCPWCMPRGGKQFVRLHLITEKTADRPCLKYDGDEMGTEAGCMCLNHAARKVLGIY